MVIFTKIKWDTFPAVLVNTNEGRGGRTDATLTDTDEQLAVMLANRARGHEDDAARQKEVEITEGEIASGDGGEQR